MLFRSFLPFSGGKPGLAIFEVVVPGPNERFVEAEFNEGFTRGIETMMPVLQGPHIEGTEVFEINAGDGAHEHPTQALLDSYSIRERLGSVKNKKVVIVGDILHSRVALSNIYALRLQGANVMVCGPKTLIPKYIEKLGVKVENNLIKALNWCDVANMLRVQNERMEISYFPSTREYTKQYGVTLDVLKNLKKEIVIMHPGPINRGVEITSEVADSEQAIILDQVQNGVAIRMAVIYLLASKIKH